MVKKGPLTPWGGGGSYFLRAMVKEYDLQPATHTVTLGEGKTPPLKISARRVAFSILGTVVFFPPT